jgi:6-pyruvoyltetrahydropterin/6-carboxytetrahydropterin synthase
MTGFGMTGWKGRHFSTKTYGHDRGFSCCFRQWKADSHCNQLHGYSLSFELVFKGELDERNWVIDFGGLKEIQNFLAHFFDHTTIVSIDDPELEWFQKASIKGLLELRTMPAVGCEKFAEFVAKEVCVWLRTNKFSDRVQLHSVKVAEHTANSATYQLEYPAS